MTSHQPRPAPGAFPRWICGNRSFDFAARPLLMGILNVTPDSFSDGGHYRDPAAAVAHALQMEADGADIIDIGGESTRPGAADVAVDEELARVMPVLEALRGRCRAALAIDTTKAAVAQAALAAGAALVNDVSACTADPAMVDMICASGAGVVLMHRQGQARTMQQAPCYRDVVTDVRDYLAGRVQALLARGIPADRMAVDPGIGFGKTLEHNTRLLGRLEAFTALARPVVVGLSRKQMLGQLTGRPVAERLAASLAGLVWSVSHGAAVMRVHDVAASRDALQVAWALRQQAVEEDGSCGTDGRR